jgi:mannose-1-phosphate guanylyltransferase
LVAADKAVEQHQDKIVFIAQKPRFASENLGWIEFGNEMLKKDSVSFHSFIDFQYRPDKETAAKYFTSGHHAWNLGYFVTTPRFLWKQYERFAPDLFGGLTRIANTWRTGQFEETLQSVYPTLEKISFDNAVLEKLDPADALVVSENIEWSDIGAWEALKEALEEAADKNVTQGKVLLTDTHDSLVYNYTDQILVTIDVENMLVVSTKDVIMVCKKSSVPKIKKLVESLSGTENDHLT